MKAFITGSTGFVGSHLVDRLISKGFEVNCFVRKTSNLRWLENKPVKYVYGDLSNSEKIADYLSEIDYVFNVAGVVKSKTKEGYHNSNVITTRSLLETISKSKIKLKRFVHISSLAACGPAPDMNALSEEYIPRPITAYGISKRNAEKEVLKYRDNFPVVILRPPAIFGPRDTEILIYFKTFLKGLNSIIGFNDKYLSLIYVEDFIDGIMLSIEKEYKSGEIFFISSDKYYDWNEISEITSAVSGKKPIKIRIPHFLVFSVGFINQFISLFTKSVPTLNYDKCVDITRERWICSNVKASKVLGFRENHALMESFKKTLDWYKIMNWL